MCTLLSSPCALCGTALQASVVPQWTMLWWRLWGDTHALHVVSIRVWVYPCTPVAWCCIEWSLCNADNQDLYWWATRYGFMHVGSLVSWLNAKFAFDGCRLWIFFSLLRVLCWLYVWLRDCSWCIRTGCCCVAVFLYLIFCLHCSVHVF